MRLHKGDLLKVEQNGKEKVFRIVKIALTNESFWLSEHNESGKLQERHDDPDDQFRWDFLSFSRMKARRARKITVDLLGRVHDPGPPQ
jgi:CRISPR-associated endonuclease Csn1